MLCGHLLINSINKLYLYILIFCVVILHKCFCIPVQKTVNRLFYNLHIKAQLNQMEKHHYNYYVYT